MTSTGSRAEERRLTARGAATRARIVDAAAQLMATRGVAATTLDDVRAASGTSKSQLYHHFEDKDALVHAVVKQQGEQTLELNARSLSRLNSMRGLELWRNAVLQKVTIRNGAYGCELGSLAAELSDVDEDARVMLASMFQTWEQLFIDGFERMQQSGILRDDAEPARLATAVIAALQGGYLLSQAAHAVEPMRVSLDMALDYVRSFQTSAAAPRKRAVAQKRTKSA
jgi:AcrR family transcriptional regulator